MRPRFRSAPASQTGVLPYHDDLRLLVIHAKSKNPRSTTFELDSRPHDSYQLRVRKLASDAKVGTVFHEDEGDLLATADLLKLAGDNYEFLPNSGMDDMQTVVLPVGTTVSVIAEMKIHTGTRDVHGEPDTDSNSTSTVVHVDP